MNDDIDKAFAGDLEKLGKKRLPLEMQVNAARAKAAQDPGKKGAEMPDLGAPGKGKGGRDPALKKESSRKQILHIDGRGVMDAARDALTSKPGVAAGGVAAGLVGGSEYERRRAKKEKEKREKKASLDEQYDAEMRQVVGLDAAESMPDFERPDVHIDGQTTDRIDDSYIDWMQGKADEDVVKEAMDYTKAGREAAQGTVGQAADIIRKSHHRGAMKGAAAATATLAAGAALYTLGKRQSNKGATKTAAVSQPQENLDLMERIKKRAAQGLPLQGDV